MQTGKRGKILQQKIANEFKSSLSAGRNLRKEISQQVRTQFQERKHFEEKAKIAWQKWRSAKFDLRIGRDVEQSLYGQFLYVSSLEDKAKENFIKAAQELIALRKRLHQIERPTDIQQTAKHHQQNVVNELPAPSHTGQSLERVLHNIIMKHADKIFSALSDRLRCSHMEKEDAFSYMRTEMKPDDLIKTLESILDDRKTPCERVLNWVERSMNTRGQALCSDFIDVLYAQVG